MSDVSLCNALVCHTSYLSMGIMFYNTFDTYDHVQYNNKNNGDF